MAAHILFFHGFEGSPQGRKPTALRAAGFDVEAPDFGVRPLMDRLAEAEALTQGRTGLVIVGSSYGGALAVLLADRHPDRFAAMVLCAPALRPELVGQPERVPAHTRIVHGVRDDICPIDASRRFAERHGAVLVETDDGHRLADSIDEIIEAVRAVLNPRSSTS